MDLNQFFERKGYSVDKIWQPWRHVVGMLTKNSNKYFFKMSGTKHLAGMVRNEAKYLHDLEDKRLSLSVPLYKESGWYKGNYWFVSDWIEGELAVEKEKGMIRKECLSEIPKVSKSIKQIMAISKSEQLDISTLNKLAIKNIDEWISKLKIKPIDQLVEFVKSNMKHCELAFAHGDFDFMNILINHDNLYLIDWEHAGVTYKFYDLAYCYHRLYTKWRQPDWADKLLKEFIKNFALNSHDKLQIRVMLGQRLIGGYFDALSDNLTDIDLQRQLEERMINDRVF